jgi:CBS domain-containing protein
MQHATLQTHHISWLAVVDADGRCVGLIAEEDVAVAARG